MTEFKKITLEIDEYNNPQLDLKFGSKSISLIKYNYNKNDKITHHIKSILCIQPLLKVSKLIFFDDFRYMFVFGDNNPFYCVDSQGFNYEIKKLGILVKKTQYDLFGLIINNCPIEVINAPFVDGVFFHENNYKLFINHEEIQKEIDDDKVNNAINILRKAHTIYPLDKKLWAYVHKKIVCSCFNYSVKQQSDKFFNTFLLMSNKKRGKSALIKQAMKCYVPPDNLYFSNGGRLGSISRIGSGLTHSTFPCFADEFGHAFEDNNKTQLIKNSISDLYTREVNDNNGVLRRRDPAYNHINIATNQFFIKRSDDGFNRRVKVIQMINDIIPDKDKTTYDEFIKKHDLSKCNILLHCFIKILNNEINLFEYHTEDGQKLANRLFTQLHHRL
jgi:hypothetical protein